MIQVLNLPRGRKRKGSSEVTLKKMGITKKESHEYQKMASHPNVIEQVLKESKERGNVPYKKSILKRIDKFYFKKPKTHVKQIPAINKNHKKAWRKVIPYREYYILNIKPGVWGIFSPYHIVESEKDAKELINTMRSCNPADVERSREIEKINTVITFCIKKKEAGEEKDIRNCYHSGCPYADKPTPLPE
jgi:hypothetical protein